ncbi:MAG: MerR family transcriptional regulator [Candidatus Izemoplasmatales bacterium]
MQKIGIVAKKTGLSPRTLRFWEEAKIIKSIRAENGYRYYDEENIARINQIRILRSLELPLSEIEKILISKDMALTISILKRHHDSIKKQGGLLLNLSVVINRIIDILSLSDNQDSLFLTMEQLQLQYNKNDSIIHFTPRDGDISMEKTKGFRVVNLPKMIVAAIAFSGENPEDACWNATKKLVKQYQLNQEPGYRNIGFGYNGPEGQYIYELWVTVPQNFAVPVPFIQKQYSGGLHAALSTPLADIMENWNKLHELVISSEKYEPDYDDLRGAHCFEECLDEEGFFREGASLSDRELDLLLPIKRLVDDDVVNTIVYQEVPELVTIPEIKICGTYIIQKANAKPWNKHVPWYALAQMLYQVGSGMKECLDHGSDTMTLVYGTSLDKKPFYLETSAKVEKVFASVLLQKSLPFLSEGLVEMILPHRRYIKFTAHSVQTTKGKNPLLKFNHLYELARDYSMNSIYKFSTDFCIERDYRADGRIVDRIELYLPIVD